MGRDTQVFTVSTKHLLKLFKLRAEKGRKKKSLHRLARAQDFLSQDINEEMTHTCKERKKEGEGRRRKERGSEGCRFQGDEGW